MKSMGKVIIAITILLGLTIIGTARPSDSSKIRLAEDGLRVRTTENGVRLSMQLKRSVRLPVSGVVKAQLYNLEGKRLVRKTKEIYLITNPTHVALTLDVPNFEQGKPEQYILEYGFQSRGRGFKKRSSLYNLVSLLETRVMGAREVMAGSSASLRVLVRDANGDRKIEGAKVAITLDGEKVFTGKTNRQGTLSPTFRVPSKSGSVKLAVIVDSPEGSDHYEDTLKIKEVNRVLLVTDKPLYQPGQDIHLRALALRQPYLKPLNNRNITFEVEDSKGNKVFKRTMKTNDFGIASAIFTLATEVNMGEYKVRVVMEDDTKVEKTVTVDRYVLPKFKITFEPDRPFYQPGQQLHGTINAQYFFGKPVANGQVSVTASKFDVGFHPFASIEGKTDREGHYKFELKLPDYFIGEPLEQGKARVRLELSVTDGADHEEVKTAWLVISKTSLLLEAIPESGSLVRGVPNKIYVLASRPGGEPARVEFYDPFSQEWLSTDDLGIGVLTVTPQEKSLNLTLKARDEKGNSITKKFKLAGSKEDDAILVRTDRGIYRAGDDIHLAVLSSRDGTAYIDLIQEGQVVHTAWTEIRNGVGEFNLTIPLDSQGSAVIHAYRITPNGNWLRDSRRIFIEPATDLRIEVRPDKKSYLPAEDATINFLVKDRRGEPVAAALGIQIVDESVFALQDMRPGLERIYFLLEQELAKPRYEIHGFSIPGIITMVVPAAGSTTRKNRIGQVLLAAADTGIKYDLITNTADARQEKFKKAARKFLEIRADKIIKAGGDYIAKGHRRSINYPKDIDRLTKGRFLKRSDLIDLWGTRIRVKGYHPYPNLTSAGPDGHFDTSDDIHYDTAPPPRPIMAFNGAFAGNGGRGKLRRRPRGGRPLRMNGGHRPKMAKKRNGDRKTESETTGGGGEEPRVRSYFPETLWVEPSLITDGSGHASATITMADSITTWRLTAMANSNKGALGSTSEGIRVFQEFFVDINLPVALTRNDRVTIPVAIYNYLPGSQDVRLELEPGDWFKIHGDRKTSITLEKNEVRGVGFDITVKDVGVHSLTVKAYGQTRSDAVRRSVEVIPDGREQVTNFNGRLDGKIAYKVMYPEVTVPGANKLFVKVYPGLLAQVVEGLDNIFRMPSGCFEQTSSITYPNILVLDYMQKAGAVTPELKMKAEGFINNGYQRLLTFEVRGGGFEWFGNAPAHIVLTAYGLMEFHDMSKVHTVDPAIIQRTQEWLARVQESNGSWKPTSHYLDQVAKRFASDVLRNTAYVAWALVESEYSGAALNKAIGYLKENRSKAQDMYTKALILIALASEDPKDPVAGKLSAEIIEAGIVKENTISFPAGGDTAVHSTGKSADVETTALVGLALLKMGTYREVVEKIINYLIETKDPHGTWYSTQATVMSLKLLVGSLDMSTEGGDAVVKVLVDGAERGQFSLEGEKADILQQIDLSKYATTGDHRVSLEIAGEGNAFYALTARHYIPWGMLGPERRQPLALRVSYDRSKLEVNDTVTAKIVARNMTPAVAHMVIIDLGIPPGFEVLTEDLDRYVKNETIQRYNMTGRQIIVYLEKINPKSRIELTYRMKATMPMRAQSFAGRLYEYYNPERESFANPVKFEVKRK